MNDINMISIILGIFTSVVSGVLLALLVSWINSNKEYRRHREEMELEKQKNREDKITTIVETLSALCETQFDYQYDKVIKEKLYTSEDRVLYHKLYENYKKLTGDSKYEQKKQTVLKYPDENDKYY
jgi:hypothetical protein